MIYTNCLKILPKLVRSNINSALNSFRGRGHHNVVLLVVEISNIQIAALACLGCLRAIL
jgi:hypothetical protein